MGSKKALKFIDLFSGCGGFSYGLEKAGHKCLLGIDFNKDASLSFKRNHPHAISLNEDIKNLTKKRLSDLLDIREIDMVIGGPPCQGFSTVGKGDVLDERNVLFKEFVRVVKIVEPKIIIFENVTGILAKKNEKTLKAIFKSFQSLGYVMDARVLSSEEFGVPSRRRRTIIMGVLGGEPVFPEVSHGLRGHQDLTPIKDVFKLLKKKNISNHDPSLAQIKNEIERKRISHIPMGKGIRYEEDERAYLPSRLRFDVDWDKLSEKRFRQTKLQRLDLNDVAPTILTSRTTYYHPTEDRYLTSREASLCQSFPLEFEFIGSETSVFRQIGNAVPPLLAESIGQAIKKIKFNKTKRAPKHKHEIFEGAFEYHKSTFI